MLRESALLQRWSEIKFSRDRPTRYLFPFNETLSVRKLCSFIRDVLTRWRNSFDLPARGVHSMKNQTTLPNLKSLINYINIFPDNSSKETSTRSEKDNTNMIYIFITWYDTPIYTHIKNIRQWYTQLTYYILYRSFPNRKVWKYYLSFYSTSISWYTSLCLSFPKRGLD